MCLISACAVGLLVTLGLSFGTALFVLAITSSFKVGAPRTPVRYPHTAVIIFIIVSSNITPGYLTVRTGFLCWGADSQFETLLMTSK